MKVFALHNGCETNLYDSERAKLLMLSDENILSTKKEDADVIIFHACTFAQHKEDESERIVEGLLKTTSKKIIVSGCYLRKDVIDDRVSYIKNENLPAHIAQLNATQEEKKLKQKKGIQLLPYVQISRGCYGNCTFCSIKSVKGSHKSRPIKEILDDIEERQHYDTIKLVGDEDAGYGRDIGISLKVLIEEIVNRFPKMKIKLGSLNAKILKRFTLDELAIFAHENVVGNIHIPIQSASNKILNAMSRGYSIEEYTSIYDVLKQLGVKNISADIISGFPGEDEYDHEMNLNFISNRAFSFMEAFVYHERKGTVAAEMEQVDFAIRERRTSEIIVKYLKGYSYWNNIPYELLLKQTPVFHTNINFKNK